MAKFQASILGIPHIPTVTKVNVRVQPTTSSAKAFESPLNIICDITDVKPDAQNEVENGKLYQWFNLTFPDGKTGWVRDDLVEIFGDGTAFGYGVVASKTKGFDLTRQEVTSPPPSTSSETEVSTPPATNTEVTTTPPTENTEVSSPPSTSTETAPASNVQQGVGFAIGQSKTGVNMRGGPGTGNTPVGKLMYQQKGKLLGSGKDQGGTRFRWANIEVSGVNGWVREDFLRYEGDYASFGLGDLEAYPSPVPDSWWVRDYNYPFDPAIAQWDHWGWDFGGEVGAPIFAGPKGGTVAQTMTCTKCRPGAESTVKQNLGLGNQSVLEDPAWGFGYGNFVVVVYTNDKLPAFTKAIIEPKGFSHIFVLYGHLSAFSVKEGQEVGPGAQIAQLGNTGNSEAPHLHLEVRGAKEASARWSSLPVKTNLLDPIVLFNR